MPAVTLPAHFDGKKIVLDTPYELQPNTPLNVVILSAQDDEEREDWIQFGKEHLARAYGPEYTLADVKKLNPEYRGPKLDG